MDIDHGQYIEALTAVGGNSWTKGEHYRIYFDEPAVWAGLEVERYKTGNIASAAWRGETISNGQAALLSASVEKVWFDIPTWKWMSRLNRDVKASNVASKAEVLDAALENIAEAAKVWLADKYGAPDDNPEQAEG